MTTEVQIAASRLRAAAVALNKAADALEKQRFDTVTREVATAGYLLNDATVVIGLVNKGGCQHPPDPTCGLCNGMC